MRKDQPAIRALRPAEAARQTGAEAAREAGQELELGGLQDVFVYYENPTLQVLGALLIILSSIGLFLALCSIAVVTPGPHDQPTEGWALSGLAGVALGAGCVMNVIGRREQKRIKSWLARYQDGFAQVLLSGSVRAVRWADVSEVGVTYDIIRGPGTTFDPGHPYTVVSGFYARPCLTRLEPTITRDWVDYVQATALVADAMRVAGPRVTAALIAAHDSGEFVAFGQVCVDQSGITLPAQSGRRGWPADLVPWSGISSVEWSGISLAKAKSVPGRRNIVEAIDLRCEGTPKRRRISLSGVPNGIFLPALLQHAARHGIPTRL
jgi:hypothetical protein